MEVARAGYLSPEVVFVDGTHIKANANLKKRVKKEIPVAAKRYQEQLDAEIDADRAAHGKKPLKKKDDDDGSTPARQKTVTESTTDPDSGVFQKGEHQEMLRLRGAYGLRQAGLCAGNGGHARQCPRQRRL